MGFGRMEQQSDLLGFGLGLGKAHVGQSMARHGPNAGFWSLISTGIKKEEIGGLLGPPLSLRLFSG
jgi:hypothetical protein